MGLETLTLRPFDRQDAIDLEGGALDIPTIGTTAVIDGKPVAYAGVYKLQVFWWQEGRDFAFFHISDCKLGKLLQTRAPLFIHRIITDALKELAAGGVDTVYTLCDALEYPTSPKWLAVLGFKPMATKPFDILVIESHLSRSTAKTWVRTAVARAST